MTGAAVADEVDGLAGVAQVDTVAIVQVEVSECLVLAEAELLRVHLELAFVMGNVGAGKYKTIGGMLLIFSLANPPSSPSSSFSFSSFSFSSFSSYCCLC